VAEMEAAHARMEEGLLARLGKVRSRALLNLLHEFASAAQEIAKPADLETGHGVRDKPSRRAKTVVAPATKAAKRKQSARPAPPLPSRKRLRD
jgi:hypothetical protein